MVLGSLWKRECTVFKAVLQVVVPGAVLNNCGHDLLK